MSIRPCLDAKSFLKFDAVSLLIVFDNYCPTMDELGSKDSSRDFQLNCVISFCFCLYLMLHTCAARFDVTRNFWGELNKAQVNTRPQLLLARGFLLTTHHELPNIDINQIYLNSLYRKSNPIS